MGSAVPPRGQVSGSVSQNGIISPSGEISGTISPEWLVPSQREIPAGSLRWKIPGSTNVPSLELAGWSSIPRGKVAGWSNAVSVRRRKVSETVPSQIQIRFLSVRRRKVSGTIPVGSVSW